MIGRWRQWRQGWLARRRAQRDDANKLYVSGQAAGRRGEWGAAVAHLEAAHWLAPERADIAAALGHAAFKVGNLRLALPALQYARNYFPRDRRILETLLAIAGRMDSPSLEKAVFDDLMRLDPKRYHKKVPVEKN